MALITQSDLEARLGRSLTAEEQSAFPIINDATQAWVERFLGTGVEAVEATTRYYDGGLQHLDIDLATDVSAINIVDDDLIVTDTLDTSDYSVEPSVGTLKSMIRHRSGGGFRTGLNNIKVTAKFSIYGDEKVRAIVKNAMLDMLEQAIGNSDNIKKESIEGYTVEYGEFKETPSMKALDSLVSSLL